MKNRTTATLATVALAGMVGLVGCSSGTAETLDNGDQKDVTIAVFQGWDEGVAASYLWKAVLEEKGYDVELEDADVAPVYEGLSSSTRGSPRPTRRTWTVTARMSPTSVPGTTTPSSPSP